ncbi:MAG: hypothetical protein RSE14_03870 [Erythrobacter sp.]|jgi:hypothetical protein|uniref:hypothetical protein n=1 Tax=Erythrobacter sp. TaxID=1042 RepID=UPI002B45E48D|nr:hypothetical protein [Erythrobacter sp.]WRH71245.1 MAG: hypothetical protein RSE14_03870 [Erythrobacter sp.]
MLTRRAKSLSVLALAGFALGAAVPAAAEDASVASRLDRAGLKYEVDADGDYKLTFNYKSEGRSQLVFVGGRTETVAGMTVREVFSPAAKVDEDGITGRKALELLEESSSNKLGSWEIRGGVLYFVIKLLDDASATQLSSMLDIAAETADNEEIKISGDKDAL